VIGDDVAALAEPFGVELARYFDPRALIEEFLDDLTGTLAHVAIGRLRVVACDRLVDRRDAVGQRVEL